MKFGLQTIAWDDLEIEKILREVKQTGYSGVEIAQPIPESEYANVWHLLTELRLELAGLSGGNLGQRLQFARYIHENAPGYPLPYIYADDWTQFEDNLYVNAGVPCTIAIHPHMFKPIQTEADALDVLARFAYTTMMPDTGHLVVAGEDPLAVLQKNLSRLSSVHLKDWSPEFGRSLPFYSKGFCALGHGVVPIAAVVSALRKASFAGWIIVEQDYCSNASKSAITSLEFLRRQMQ